MCYQSEVIISLLPVHTSVKELRGIIFKKKLTDRFIIHLNSGRYKLLFIFQRRSQFIMDKDVQDKFFEGLKNLFESASNQPDLSLNEMMNLLSEQLKGIYHT